jgi:hypothetical protein
MNDPNVHVGTHPTGEPNRTAVNTENPIFGRPVDSIPEVSIEQAAVVQSEKNPRETVVSPLINEPEPIDEEPVVENTETLHEQDAKEVIAVQEAEQVQDLSPSAEVETKEYTDGTSATGVAPLPDLSPAQQDAEGELNGADPHPVEDDAEPEALIVE